MSLLCMFQWLKQVMCLHLTPIAGEIHSFSMPRNGGGWGIDECLCQQSSIHLFSIAIISFVVTRINTVFQESSHIFSNLLNKGPVSLRTSADKERRLGDAHSECCPTTPSLCCCLDHIVGPEFSALSPDSRPEI